MTPSAVQIRPARADDLPSLAAFIARVNVDPAQRCLHCPASSPVGVRAALRDAQLFPGGWERAFVVGTLSATGEIVAAFGCQTDPGDAPGYLWGPWIDTGPGGWSGVAPGLLTELLTRLPVSTPSVDAFLHVDNQAGRRFLVAQGFRPGPTTHIYVASRAGWADATAAEPETTLYPPLRPAHEVAFAKLHADTFPAHASTPAQSLLDARDDAHAIFAATDGLRLLGSVCVSVNQAPREGFVDYLAVKPAARGRGVGARLLRTALHWAFATRQLPQVALTVSDWRAEARRLYEHADFRFQDSGVALRRRR